MFDSIGVSYNHPVGPIFELSPAVYRTVNMEQ